MGCANSTMNLKRKFEDDFELGAKIGDGSFTTVFAVRRLEAGAKPALLSGWGSEGSEGPEGWAEGCEELVVKTVDLQGFVPGTKDKASKRSMTLTKLAIRDKIGKHEHCVSLHEVFVQKTGMYMVSERCPRTLLMELTDHPIVSEADAGFWFRQMVAGIAHLHLLGIVHRGVCPKKFLLGVDGKVKLNDFSRAVILPKNSPMGNEEKSDVWELGVVLYELLYGSLPYPNASEASVFEYTSMDCKTAVFEYPSKHTHKHTEGSMPSFEKAKNCKTSLFEYASMEQFVKTLLREVPEKRPSAAEAFLALRHPENMETSLESISVPSSPKLLLPVNSMLLRAPLEDEEQAVSPSRRRMMTGNTPPVSPSRRHARMMSGGATVAPPAFAAFLETESSDTEVEMSQVSTVYHEGDADPMLSRATTGREFSESI